MTGPSTSDGRISLSIAGRVALFALLGAASVYAKMTLNPIQDSVQFSLHLTDNQMSIAQGLAAAIPMVLLCVYLGRMIDTASRILLIRILLALCLAASLWTSFATDFVSLAIARGIAGSAALSMVPVVYALVADAVPEQYRGRANTVVAIGQSAGAGAPFLLVAIMAHYMAIDVEWRTALRLMAVPFAIVLAIAFIMREPARIAPVEAASGGASSIRQFFSRYRFVLLIIAGENCAEICLNAMMVWGTPFFTRGVGMDLSTASSVAGAIFLFGGIVGSMAGGALIDLLSGRGAHARSMQLLALLSFLTALCGVGMLAPSSFVAVGAFGLLFFIGNAVTMAGLTAIANAVAPELRGTALTLWATSAMLFGIGVAPLATSMSAGLFRGGTAIGHGLAVVCIVFSIIGTVAFLIAQRRLRVPPAGESALSPI